jgi:hypothetical protein
MKVSTAIDNNFGYEKISQLVDNIPLINVLEKESSILIEWFNFNCMQANPGLWFFSKKIF